MGGITTESQVVYLMTGLRKLLEQQQAKKQYEYLTFHCDWVLHSKLRGTTAQKVLEQFDLANIHLRTGIELHDLPVDLQREIDGISKMEWFRKELSTFLAANGLPGLETVRRDGWTHFLHLYGKVVEDCPLEMTTNNTAASIEKVTVHLELANQVVETEIFYKITWTVADKNGLSGDIFVINRNPLDYASDLRRDVIRRYDYCNSLALVHRRAPFVCFADLSIPRRFGGTPRRHATTSRSQN